MSGHWKDHGIAENFLTQLIPGPKEHLVEDTATGEFHGVFVGSDETVGEAISNGSWSKEDYSHLNK